MTKLEQPFAWGSSDCLSLAADMVEALTGVDPMKGLRRYRSAAGAARVLSGLGFSDLEAAIAAVLPAQSLTLARRGDIGVLAQDGGNGRLISTVLVAGEMAFGRTPAGRIAVPVLNLKSAYRVG
ncbi:MAG: hypothetical protein GC202_14295 [Alphaproteobacteria bacterium]|nr:hypothetical protein [Alphaproteobacteria bacterium]